MDYVLNICESDRNRLEKRKRTLLLAASDMEQAAAATIALVRQEDWTTLPRQLLPAVLELCGVQRERSTAKPPRSI
jgi:hypothetical protein